MQSSQHAHFDIMLNEKKKRRKKKKTQSEQEEVAERRKFTEWRIVLPPLLMLCMDTWFPFLAHSLRVHVKCNCVRGRSYPCMCATERKQALFCICALCSICAWCYKHSHQAFASGTTTSPRFFPFISCSLVQFEKYVETILPYISKAFFAFSHIVECVFLQKISPKHLDSNDKSGEYASMCRFSTAPTHIHAHNIHRHTDTATAERIQMPCEAS